MKPKPLTLSFLDLLFSAFASCILLNIILTISVGRTEHRVQKDFILARVVWKKKAKNFSKNLLLKSKQSSQHWKYVYHSPPTSKKRISLFFTVPEKSDIYTIECQNLNKDIKYLEITTRNGKKIYKGNHMNEIAIAMEER